MPRSKKSRPFKIGEIIRILFHTKGIKYLADGTLVIKTAWFTDDGNHIDGATYVKPNEPDYSLWQWLLKCREEGNLELALITNKDLEDYRAAFKASAVLY